MKTSAHRFLVGLAATVIWLTPGSAASEPTARAFGFVAGEAYVTPELAGHGLFFVGALFDHLPGEATARLELNTDTLTAAIDGVQLSETWSAGGRLRGEYRFAGLLTDYWRRGQNVPERTFSASFVEGAAYLQSAPGDDLYLRLEMGAKRWFFAQLDETSPRYLLPPEAWIISPEMSFTYWGVEHDAAYSDLHRLTPRTRGLAFGASVGLDHRTNSRPWGALNGRNDPESTSGVVRQWLRWGVEPGGAFRFEVFEEAGLETGGDDLTRRRVGGMNPYVARVSGAPWPAWLASRWLAGGVRGRVAVGEQVEVGLVVDAAIVSDVDRTGSSGTGGAAGTAIELDWRPGDAWQIDASLGWSPDTGAWASRPHFGAWFLVGRSF